LVHYFLF